MKTAELRPAGGGWKYLALGLLVLSFLTTGFVVSRWLLRRAGEGDLTRYLPEQCLFVGYVRWDNVTRSDAYRQLCSLGGWTERDEDDCLRFVGFPTSALQSILFAGDFQKTGAVALVQTFEPFRIEAVVDYLKVPKQNLTLNDRTMVLAGDLAYCQVADNQLFLGDSSLVRKILNRKAQPPLSGNLAQFVRTLPETTGIRCACDATALANSHLTVQNVDLHPVLAALAEHADYCTLQCDFSTNLQSTLLVSGKKAAGLAATGIDFSSLTSATRDEVTMQLHIPSSLFDARAWPVARNQARWSAELMPSAVLEPLLEALTPGFYWTKVLLDTSHPLHEKARQALRDQGTAAVPYLARGLSHGKASTRAEVVRALGDLGAAAEPALPYLADVLNDTSSAVRLEAIRVFPLIGQHSPLTRLSLLQCLGNPPDTVASAALEQLAKLPPPTLEEIPGMLNLTKSRHPVLWKELLRELSSLGVQARSQNNLDNSVLDGMLRGLLIDDQIEQLARIQLQKLRPFLLQERSLLMQIVQTPAARDQARAYALTALAEDGLATADVLGEIGQRLQTDPKPLVRQAAAEALGNAQTESTFTAQLLIHALQDKAADVRLAAVAALGSLGAKNTEVVPVLLRLLEGPPVEMQTQACFALGKCGPRAMLARPMLLKVVSESTGLLRVTAEQTLKKIGLPKPEDAAGCAGQMHLSTDSTVRWCAAKVIDELGAKAGAELLTVCRALDDTDPALRLVAISALSKYGAKCPADLVPALIKAMEDIDKDVRTRALTAIPLLDVEQQRPFLDRLLASSSEPETRRETLRSVEIMSTKAAQLTSTVTECLQAKEGAVRIQAIKTLAAISPENELPALRPILAKMLADKDTLVHLQIMELIKKRGKPMVPLLKEALGSKDMEVRLMSLIAVRELGGQAEDCLPELRRYLAPNTPPKLRLAALAALGSVGPGAEQTAKDLGQLLKDDDVGIRKAVLSILAGLGPKALPAKDSLVSLMRSAEREEFEATLKTFRTLKLEPKEKVIALLGAFRNKDAEVRALLVQEISKLGRPAVFPLTEQLDHTLPAIRFGAVLSLAQIGGEADGAVGALQRRFQVEPLPQLREEILNALQKIHD